MEGPCLSPNDLYRLRAAHLQARQAALQAEMARQRLDAVLLEIERRYDLLGQEVSVDARTGRITPAGEGEPSALADGRREGRG